MSKKIVVIDDEQDILEIVKATLKTKGYQLYAADNGEDGWRLIQQNRPDLIITDLKMPRMSGLELRKRLQASKELKDTPIIVMSGIGRETGKGDEFWRTGLKTDDFISKPFDPLDLLGRVEYIFRRKDYISSGANGSRVQTHSPSDSVVVSPGPSLKDLRPEEVVRIFVESWNSQDFPREFRCLAEEMTGGISEKDYIHRRMQCYQEVHGQYRNQKVLEVESTKTSHNLSSVVIIREDTQGARTTKSKQSFALRKTAQGWKIVSVRSKSI